MKKKETATFYTKEVVALVLITCVVSFTMGVVLFGDKKIGTKILDSDLNNMIEQYNYIVNNYYEEVDKKELVDGAIKGMIESLGDDYGAYMEQEDYDNFNITLTGSYQGIGVSIATTINDEIMVVGIFEGSPADKAGLKVMDIIKTVDGESLEKKSANDLTNIIKTSKNDTFKLGVIRDGKEIEIIVKRELVTISSVETKIIEKNDKKIGYIQVGIFADNTYEQFKNKLEQLEKEGFDTLILDLRGNSGGHLDTVTNMTSLFLNSKKIIYQMQTKVETTKINSKGKKDKTYPIYILIDNGTASASEVMASALSEQLGAKLVGETSFGKGTVQEVIFTTSGDQYKFTTKKWLTSKGNWLNKKGLKPDIEIKLDDKYYEMPTEENDNQLNELIKIISEKSKES